MCVLGKKFLLISDIGSVWISGGTILRIRTYDEKSEFVVLVYNSRLGEVSTFPSSASESTNSLGFIRHFIDFSDFRVPSYG